MQVYVVHNVAEMIGRRLLGKLTMQVYVAEMIGRRLLGIHAAAMPIYICICVYHILIFQTGQSLE